MSNSNYYDITNSTKSYKSELTALREVITVDNAIIDSVYRNNRYGFVTISYGMMDDKLINYKYVVTLIIGKNTRMTDQFGKRMGLRDLRESMVVSARFSSRMSRSNPPQSMAFRITVVKESDSSIIEDGRVLDIERFDDDYNYLLTGYANSLYSQMRYVITDSTLLRDQRGNRIPLRAIQPGQIVRIERASFQTMSIPPQTSALTVQIITD